MSAKMGFWALGFINLQWIRAHSVLQDSAFIPIAQMRESGVRLTQDDSSDKWQSQTQMKQLLAESQSLLGLEAQRWGLTLARLGGWQ